MEAKPTERTLDEATFLPGLLSSLLGRSLWQTASVYQCLKVLL